MSASAKLGTFITLTTDTTSTTYATGSLGFIPKAVICWWNGSGSATNTNGSWNLRRGMGFATGTGDRRAAGTYSQDAAAAATTGNGHSNVAVAISVNASAAIDGAIDISAWDSDSVTFICDDVWPADTTITYLILGGSDITAQTTGQFQEPGSVTTQDVTPGFQPDMVLFCGAGPNTSAPPSAQTESSNLTIGFACRDSTGTTQQGSWMGQSDSGSTTMDTDQQCTVDGCFAFMIAAGAGTVNTKANLSAWLSNGFTLNYSASASTRYVHYLALQGGRWFGGSSTTSITLSATIATSGYGFSPVAGFLLSGGDTAFQTGTTSTTTDRAFTGAYTSTSSRMAVSWGDLNSAADSDTGGALEYDECYASVTTSGGYAINGLMDVNSIDSDGTTFIMDDADTAANKFWFWAYGPKPVPSMPSWHPSFPAKNNVAGKIIASGFKPPNTEA